MQTATILKFPMLKPDTLTIQLIHLEFAAELLKELGAKAKAAIYSSASRGEIAGLSTDVHGIELVRAIAKAHTLLCEFLTDEIGLKQYELPFSSAVMPTNRIKARSGYTGGQVVGWSE